MCLLTYLIMECLSRSLRLKSAVILSCLCHIFLFISLDFTFGKQINKTGFEATNICFLGAILYNTDYMKAVKHEVSNYQDRFNFAAFSDDIDKKDFLEQSVFFSDASIVNKPIVCSLTDGKILFPKETTVFQKSNKKEHSIMFYPSMPYHFLLYFRDRQTAHMEVSFYISSTGKITNLKRKISSGNPEVDLLVMRNIIHFLNNCKSNFTLDAWQTVKIDLSP